MTEAYHHEALRKQRIVDKKHEALARIKYGEVRRTRQIFKSYLFVTYLIGKHGLISGSLKNTFPL